MGKEQATKGGGSLVEDDLKHLAKEWDMSLNETKKNILESLQVELKQTKTPDEAGS